VFLVHGSGLCLRDKVPSGGAEPNAVAQHANLVYVLNVGASSNVVGFRLGTARGPMASSILHSSEVNRPSSMC
jgi:hypothetical protein